MTTVKRELRCAIYTRKSSDEGLEQEFNSIDAQREACEAYIRSQASEGWKPIRARYDDGGYSGGTMERPALQQLLADIRARRVDIVVVYKVDRLTRSLTDFAKIVEVFDAQGISFYNERSRLLFTVIAEPSVSCAPLCCCRAASACFGEQRPLVGGVLFGSSVRSLRAANSGRGIHAILRPHFSRPVCRLRQRTMNVPAAQLSHARAPSEPTLQVF